MRAVVVEKVARIEEGHTKLAEVLTPEPQEGQIRIKVSVCGLCHTDLHTIEGEIPTMKLPVIPGHQVVGIVDALGKGARRYKEGDRVGVTWLWSACGGCRFCKRGFENLCPDARFTGYHVDGGYAEYMVVPENFAYQIPENYLDEYAAPLLCAGVIGYRALRLAGEGEKLGLFGFGASAHIVIQVARYRGWDVFVFTRGEQHRTLARELGAVWTGGSYDKPPEKLDAAIIFAPAGELISAALEVLNRGGILILAGIYMSPTPPLEYEKHLWYEKVIRSVANVTRTDAEEFLLLAPKVPVKTEVEVFPLEEVQSALLRLKRREMKGAGVLRVSS